MAVTRRDCEWDHWWDHWLQGGPCDDLHIVTLTEPLPDAIYMVRPSEGAQWVRVLDALWPGAVVYRREPGVEQIDGERIYYPAS